MGTSRALLVSNPVWRATGGTGRGDESTVCGIAALWSARLSVEERETRVLDMLGRMSHRGPDAHRVVHEEDISIGFNRLAIVGPDGSSQPLEGRSMLCAVNGEIYNYRSLWETFPEKVCSSGGLSHDCAVLLPLAERNADAFPTELDGMFAGLTFDRRWRVLRLFRDHVGIKPMFYADTADGLACASTVAGLLPVASPEIDRRAMRHYLENGYAGTSRTLIKGVRAVPPGSTVTFRSARDPGRGDRWFRPERFRTAGGVRELVQASVASEIPDGWPTASTLSGGIDSTLVTLLLRDLVPDLTAMTVRYPGNADPDLLTARRLCSDYGIAHEEVPVTQADYLREVLGYWRFDQPLSDPNAIALNAVCATTRQLGSRVLLTGDGADEIFGGYGYYREPALGGVRGRVAAWRFTSMADETDREFVQRVTGRPRLRRLRPGLGDPLRQAQEHDLRHWLEPNLLAKADRFGMAEQVEVRVPFLRPRLVAAALGLPASRKVDRHRTKIALRDDFRDVLPSYVLERPKQGFPCPMGEWLRGAMGRRLRAEATWAVDNTWSVRKERHLWDEHLAGSRDWGQQLWRLTVARAWWRSVTTATPDVHRGVGYPIRLRPGDVGR